MILYKAPPWRQNIILSVNHLCYTKPSLSVPSMTHFKNVSASKSTYSEWNSHDGELHNIKELSLDIFVNKIQQTELSLQWQL